MPAANYYIDLTNGNNARTGLKIGNSTIDSTADTTHFVDDLLTGADDYINGSYFYNVTRSLGSLITDFVALTDTVTLTTAIAGMTAGDTYYILDAWKTIEQYTTTSVRTAGDIAYVRAATTETVGAANITFDESGTQAALISIIGCDATVNNPWVDASNTYPIIDFNAGAYQVALNRSYWLFQRLTFTNSTKTANGMFSTTAGIGCRWSYCNFTNTNGATASYGMYIIANGHQFIDNCVFTNNKTTNLFIGGGGIYYIANCVFDGTTVTGLYAQSGGHIFVSDTTFGSTTAHTTNDISIANGPVVYCRNCTFNKTTLATGQSHDIIYSEDDDGTFGNQVSYYFQGTITKSATVRDGGGTSSAQMMPSANCGAIIPLCLNNFMTSLASDFAIYNTSTSPVNVDIYIRSDSAWGTYPTAAQLYTEASYLSNASTAARATVVSTDVLADGTTWVRFRCTMTPARAGFIYMKVYLKLYAATEGCLIDIKPVIS